MKHPLRPWLFAAGLLVCADGLAQTMYRCGNKYQDRPCDAGQKGKAVGSTGTAGGAAPATGGSAAARCAQRGQDALKIVWAREGGATQERLESEAKTAQERELVSDVYRRRGSASQVQAAVEADCNADSDRAAQAAALEAAAARLRGEQPETAPSQPIEPKPQAAAPSSPPPPAPPAAPFIVEVPATSKSAADAERKASYCAGLNARMDDLTARERKGGNTTRLDDLRAQRRSLQNQLSSNGC
jgi:hypothetical protein